MEIEHNTSQFYPFQNVRFVAWQNSDDYTTPSRYRSHLSIDRRFRVALASLYKWLDSVAGDESYRLTSQYQPYREYFAIFDFLKAEGIARDVSASWFRYNDAPAFFRCDITAAFLPGSTDGAINYRRSFAHGFGKDISTVLSKAIGEFLERYCLMLFHKSDLLRGSYFLLRKRGLDVVNPSDFSGFSPTQIEQYPKRRFDTESFFHWERVRRLSVDTEAFVPAQFIHWNYDVTQEESEPALVEINTNGAGGGFSAEEAILSGLYELIQRDAFLIFWLNSLTPNKIRPESIPDEKFQQILAESKRYGFECHCLDTTLDSGVPSFIVVITDSSGKGPYFSLGGGCEADPAKALRRALEEAWSVYYWLKPLPPYELPKNYRPFSDPSLDQEKRLRLAANIKMAQHYHFFLNGKIKDFDEYTWNYPKQFSSKKEELTFPVKLVESLGPGYEVYSYLPKHKILERLGYYSSRVVVPKFIPLYLRETIAPLGALRLRQVPLKFGFRVPDEPNPWPHPFP